MLKPKSMTIGKKLTAAFLGVAAIALIIGIVGYVGIERTRSNLHNVGINRIPDLQHLAVLNTQRMAIRAQTFDVWTQKDTQHDVAVDAYRRIREQRQASWRAVDEAMAALKSVPRQSERGRDLMARLDQQYQAWRDGYEELDAMIDRFVNNTTDEQRTALYREYRAAIDHLIPVSDTMGATFDELTENNLANTNQIVTSSLAQAMWMERVAVVCMFLGGAMAVGLGIVISRGISRPLGRVSKHLVEMAAGDFTKSIDEQDVKRADEIGRVAQAAATLTESVRRMVGDIAGGVNTVASSSTELSATASQLASGAEETTNQSAQVAAAAEQMSANMNTMAASTEQMSANVKTVSAAIEEVTASVSEMAKSAERAATAAAAANQLVDTGNTQIGQLGSAADEIGKVIEVIQEIAEQTNLLALNATIESARAGEAGKGFAVVATEVKELAKQTAGATEDIRHRIEGIQGSTKQAVKSMEGIGDVIRQVNELSRIIASAVEEQSITTKEIARNMAQSSTAAQTVAKGVAESAMASQEIARIVVGVDQAARQAAQGAAQTQSTGRELSTVAEQLRSLVGQFQV